MLRFRFKMLNDPAIICTATVDTVLAELRRRGCTEERLQRTFTSSSGRKRPGVWEPIFLRVAPVKAAGRAEHYVSGAGGRHEAAAVGEDSPLIPSSGASSPSRQFDTQQPAFGRYAIARAVEAQPNLLAAESRLRQLD